MVLIVSSKNNYHVDEMFSFSLSNWNRNVFPVVDGKIYSPTEFYRQWMAVSPEGRFDYGPVWLNQEKDVHPPLYYALLHTLCSFTPGKIADWQPAVINFLFAFLSLWIFRRLLCLTGEEYLNCTENSVLMNVASLAYIVLPGILNNVSFFRMYVMAMFIVTWISYLTIRIALCVQTGTLVPHRYWLELFLASLFSALTHYYCVMYLVFDEIVLFAYLLLKKRRKEPLLQVLVSMAAAAASVLIFPAMIGHILSSGRGVQVRGNFFDLSPTVYLDQIKAYYTFFDKSVAGGFPAMLLIAVILLCACRFVFALAVSSPVNDDREKDQPAQTSYSRHLLCLAFILIPSLLYYILLCRITVMVSERYAFPLYTILFFAIILTIEIVLRHLRIRHKAFLVATAFILASVLAGVYKEPKWQYLYRDDSLQYTITDYCGLDCVVVYEKQFQIRSLYKETGCLNNITFIKKDDYDLLLKNGIASSDDLILFAYKTDVAGELVQRLANVDKYEEIGKRTYFTVYHLFRDNG